MVRVVGLEYVKDEEGDFTFMIKEDIYDDCLFVFNDNEEYHNTCRVGKGNAIMRQYNKYNRTLAKPRSSGIPTGNFRNRGYKRMTDEVKEIIDSAIEEIVQLINEYNYKYVVFSINKDGLLGMGLFSICQEVREYITNSLKNLEILILSK